MLPFHYARLVTGSRSYVVYRVTDPLTGELVRRRAYVDHIKPAANRKRFAARLVQTINQKLDNGWNPLASNVDSRQFTPIAQALDEYLELKLPMKSHRTVNTYRSEIRMLKEWLSKRGLSDIFISDFSPKAAQDFMDWVLRVRKVSGRTYNNYRTDFASHFNFLKRRGYIMENPFQNIDRMPERIKRRRSISLDEQNLLSNYLRKHDPVFRVSCLLVYYASVRPNEIVHLRVRDIDFGRNVLMIPAGVAKNGRERHIEMAPELRDALQRHVANARLDWWLVGLGFVPGPVHTHRNRLSERFTYIRKHLGLAPEITFYSLKDTIADRLDQAGVSLKEISRFFDHSSIAITAAYMQNFEPVVRAKILEHVQPL